MKFLFQAWWVSKTYDEYYRTWNIIVYDWLYTYVYKDFYDNVLHNKLLAKFLVILISAVVHEMIATYTLRTFFPVMSVLFLGPGLLLSSVRAPNDVTSHVLFLVSYIIGNDIEMSLYSLIFFTKSSNRIRRFPYESFPNELHYFFSQYCPDNYDCHSQIYEYMDTLSQHTVY